MSVHVVTGRKADLRIHIVVYPGGEILPASDLSSALARVTARMEGGTRYEAEAHDYPGLTAAGYGLPMLHMVSVKARKEGRDSLVIEIHDLDVGPRKETLVSSLDLVAPDHPDILLSIALTEAADLDENEEIAKQLSLVEEELVSRIERAMTPAFPAIGLDHMLSDMRNWSVGSKTILPTQEVAARMDDAGIAQAVRDAAIDRFRDISSRMFAPVANVREPDLR